jgi:hypothetical protein
VSFAGGEIVSAFAVGGAANQPLGVFALPAGAPGTLLPLLEYGAEFSPWADEMSGYLGQMVEYSLTLSNTGNVTDMFDLEPSGNNWEVHLPVTTTTQGAGEMAEVIVHVTVPLDAMHGDIDSVTVTASSQGDPGMQATSMLTTTVMWYSTYLPLIERQANE